MEDYQDPASSTQGYNTLPLNNTTHDHPDIGSVDAPQSHDVLDTKPTQNTYAQQNNETQNAYPQQYAHMQNNTQQQQYQPPYGDQQPPYSFNAPANYYRPQYSYPPIYPPQYGSYNNPARGKATAALVLGIISLVFCWMSVLAVVSLVCSIIGIVMGNSARKQLTQEQGQGQATAGLICSIIGLVLSVLMIALFTVIIISAFGYTTDFGSQFGSGYGM